MSEQKRSIVPASDLVEVWFEEAPIYAREDADYEEFIARKAALWGADQELENCCDFIRESGFAQAERIIFELRENRRPKTEPLKKQAIKILDKIQGNKEWWQLEELNVVRRALEEVPDND